jgi:hypothetical protein
MEEHKCPENLEELILSIPKMVFESLSDEPDIKIIKKVMEMDGREVSEAELSAGYREFARDYGENQRIAFELAKFGESREEIVQRLGDEIEGCVKCSARYLAFLDKYAWNRIKLSESKNPGLAGIGKIYAERGLIGNIIDADRAYLNLIQRILDKMQ